MKLTVLMDNHTEIDVYHLGEPCRFLLAGSRWQTLFIRYGLF